MKKYQQRFVHILVDEYQDTNRAQYIFMNMIAEGHRNLCAVGDPDQSVYGWRGADIRNILDFQTDWPDASILKAGGELPFHQEDTRGGQLHN